MCALVCVCVCVCVCVLCCDIFGFAGLMLNAYFVLIYRTSMFVTHMTFVVYVSFFLSLDTLCRDMSTLELFFVRLQRRSRARHGHPAGQRQRYVS